MTLLGNLAAPDALINLVQGQEIEQLRDLPPPCEDQRLAAVALVGGRQCVVGERSAHVADPRNWS